MVDLSASPNSNTSLDDHVDAEIAACLNLERPRSFFLYAGAGSGKTTSLVNALEYIKLKNLNRLRLRGQQVAVITYTNAACDEILRRIRFDTTYHVATIHSFAWRLVEGFNTDIKAWLGNSLAAEIAELRLQEEKGRAGTKASITRLAQIEGKSRRLESLDGFKKFVYSPTGENRERNALSHSEVIEICASFLISKPLLQRILVNQYPFLLVDESQDTNRRIVDALLAVQAKHVDRFCLGFIGDTMQRIYNDGKERIEEALPTEWARPSKQLNHRCPKRIVRLINQVRSQVDNHKQQARSDSIEGAVRLFVLPSTTANKSTAEDAVRTYMARLTEDRGWLARDQCKILTLEHHMAAQRMGFATIFETLGSIEDFRTGLLDGTLPATRFFTTYVLPLVEAEQKGDKFGAAKVVREFSSLISKDSLQASPDQREQLRVARAAVQSLLALWDGGSPNLRAVLGNLTDSNLFPIPDSLRPFAALERGMTQRASPEAERADPLPENVAATDRFLSASFSEIVPYARYISNGAEFGTHQGVKGLEFDRVMVLMDDAEARGFMFGYDKLFGGRGLSATDIKNEAEGRDSSITRTRRLLYVTCSRARRSLALVVYSPAPTAVRTQVLASGWFDTEEIILSLPV